MAPDRISVIVCTFNRANRITRVIEQLDAQDFPPSLYEVIIVDNNSSDNTRQAVEDLAERSRVPISYINETRTGVTFARNRGAEEARFPFLVYLDDDCSISPDWLKQLTEGFMLEKEVALVAGRIEIDYDGQEVPGWLNPKSEQWLAKYDFPGSFPRILVDPEYVCEGNMGITYEAWKSAGGFQGMDQFGNPHVASNENKYLLEQIKRMGGKIAFIPDAVAFHHTEVPEKKQLLKRVYWNGVSDGILDYLLDKRGWLSGLFYFVRNIFAILLFTIYSLFSLIRLDEARAMYYLLLAVHLIGLVLSELRLVGDWQRVQSWKSAKETALKELSTD